MGKPEARWTVRFFVKGHEWQGSRTWTSHLDVAQATADAEALAATGLASRVWVIGNDGDVPFEARTDG